MKKKAVVALLSLLMCSTMFACGNNSDVVVTESDEQNLSSESADNIEVVSENEGTENDAEEASNNQEETDGSYIQENCVELYNSKTIDIPSYWTITEKNDYVDGDIDGIKLDHNDKTNNIIMDIQKSPADKEGYSKYVFTINCTNRNDVIVDENIYSGNHLDVGIYCNYDAPTIMDYYSGIVFPAKVFANGNGDYNNELVINNEDKEYDISYYYKKEKQNGTNYWEKMDDNIWKITFKLSSVYEYTVIVPDDYDGLCLVYNTKGCTDLTAVEGDKIYHENNEKLLDIKDDEQYYGPEDYAVIRIDDMISEFEQISEIEISEFDPDDPATWLNENVYREFRSEGLDHQTIKFIVEDAIERGHTMEEISGCESTADFWMLDY